jgi:hypothetical protein
MDLLKVKQQQISWAQENLLERFPALWSGMIADWHQPDLEDRVWLMYSANYLFCTDNVRWAMDPVRLIHRLPRASNVNVIQDLEALSFVLLTHGHADHLDLGLIRSLRHLPILWVIPEPVLTLIQDQVDLPSKQIVIPKKLQPIEIQGIKVTPFDGLHWGKLDNKGNENASPLRGVPATGYLVEFRDKRWLFPGDTRTYDASQLPFFGSVDGIFAHLWLGRGCALLDAPPLLDQFCCFFSELQPRRIVLTHLMEFGRAAEDSWDISHAHMTMSHFQEHFSHIEISHAFIGQKVIL